MPHSVHASVSSKTLSIQEAYDFVSDPAHGAVDVFIGAVRNHHEGKLVSGITYDIHEDLAAKEFEGICLETQNIWEGIKIYLSHFKGYLELGGISVVIAVSAPHRAEAFEACRYVIEELKKRAPVWKQEHYETGSSEWLPGHSLRANVERLEARLLQQDKQIQNESGGCGSGVCGCGAKK